MQVSACYGVSIYVVVADASQLVTVERVRCLECGVTYLKPSGGGIRRRNPGCTRCGYIGWISAMVPFSEPAEQLRQRR